MQSLLHVTSDYTLLKSLIKIDSLIEFLKNNNFTSCALVDENLFGVMEFYTKCIKNNIKPIIGLDIIFNDKKVYCYAKNYDGYKKLIKINSKIQLNAISINDINDNDLVIVIPYDSRELFNKFSNVYLSYSNMDEYNELNKLTDNLLFINEVRCFKKEDLTYLNYLELLNKGESIDNDKKIYFNNYVYDLDNTNNKNDEFINNINIVMDNNKRYIPKYENPLNDSAAYLEKLAIMGLTKRYNGNIPNTAKERLLYELSVIKELGFTDYFLIVYDYVFYAKKNNILVGPGRGSAAGSLVSYSLGITEINPMDYNLLFERFLNKDRVTMPDIDIDFEYTKRQDVITYVKNKYGKSNVAPIITYGTLASKQVIRDVCKLFNIPLIMTDKFVRNIDPKLTLLENSKKDVVKKFVINNPEFKKIYKTALKFEGLKRHTSTHAAGIVICSEALDDVIPVYYNNDEVMTGYTMEYLEDLGLLKMDFLALKNLTIIKDTLDIIKNNNHEDINLNNINLEDKRVYDLFINGDTDGVFQFESSGMKSVLTKFKPTCFNDLVAVIAIFRPGPMENIDTFIKRKNGLEKIDYIHDDLKDILEETYGIIVYQEQIMQILVKMAGYTFSEADNIRRAMSKKKEEIIIKEKEHFISSSISREYSSEIANKVYDLILKFANYGFNKAHSVSYAKIGYQMAYLKKLYPVAFLQCLLNMSIGSDEKTKDYINLAKKHDLEFMGVDVNISTDRYEYVDSKLILPFNVLKNVGNNAVMSIIKERSNGEFKDFFDFVARTYKLGINKSILDSLIKAGAFNKFSNKQTLINNVDIAINYATLVSDLDESLVMKPDVTKYPEYDKETLREFEQEVLGFYLSGHPASKYTDVVKLKDIINYFDKSIKLVVLVDGIKSIKTKNKEDMAFLKISDDTGEEEATVFPGQYNLLSDIKKGNLVKIIGKVTKRFDKYNINLINIEKI